ncbi:MAG: hypothetical protein FJ290_21865 [Planctomycetes bacterium]|nr:hypothetical protein [Planctomycetota bacterium]
MNDYARVAKRLNTVRRAWKRTAALSGLAIVMLESTGIFTVAMLIDVLYRPRPPVRVGIFALAVAALGYLVARNIVAPLLRRIADRQLALYVEEHDQRFEGALVSAAEFRDGQFLSAQEAGLVEAIIASAAQRAERLDLRRVIDLSRLRKYGLAAAAVLVAYLAAGIGFPSAVGHHAVRVLRPWEPTQEDRPAVETPPEAKPPIAFALSRQDTSLLRGTPFDLEATLSRAPEAPVFLHFRSLAAEQAQTRWRHLPMAEVERLNGFRIVIPDVNEEMEFFVAAGEDRSPTHRISVYDPLAIEGVEVTTRYPDYLKLPDHKDVQVTGDVAAPVGSKVTVRILTNRPLADGALEWVGSAGFSPSPGPKERPEGRTTNVQPLAVDPQQKTSAFASFEVTKDAAYTFRVRDIMGQKGESAGPAAVKALPDKPPTIALTHPTETVDLNPLGEIIALADAGDDFGIEGVDFVYMRASEENPKELRLPMHVDGGTGVPPVVAKALLNFRLEDIRPPAAPEEVIAYYLECRDRKGQKAVSDIYFITVVHYETWATWTTEPMEEGQEEVRSLEPIFRAAWHIHTQKDTLPPNDYNRQSEELAATMVDPQTNQLYTYAKSHDPAKQENLRRVAEFVAKGHQALLAHDTGKAVDAFRVALAEIAKIDVTEEFAQVVPQGAVPTSSEPLKQLALIEAERVKAEAAQMQMNGPPQQSQESRRDLARQAERVAAEARDLEKKQAEVVREATDQAQATQPKEGEPQPKGAENQDAGGALAEKQEGVAQETRKAGQEAAQDPAAQADPTIAEMARKLGRAAADMQAAAQKMRTGRIEQAVPEAERARQTLREIRDAAERVSQTKLERALDEAEARLERLVDRQKETRAATEALDRAVPKGKQPDAAQQRDLRGAAADQVRLKTELGEVAKNVKELRDWAEGGARPETAKHIEQANRELVRGRADQRMANAVVELAAQRADKAAGEQKQAEATLQKALEGVRAANDSLASDIESELRRAKNEAQRIEKNLEKAEGREGEAPAEPSARDAERAAQAAYEIKRLAKHLENRDFAEPQDTQFLKQSAQNPQALGQGLAKDDEKRAEVLRVVRRVRNKLEAEYEAKLEAKKLFAAQREECPPQYRELVNKYYEALSEARK